MDGRGRALDNVFVERLWRSVKYEHVYLYEYALVPELEKGLHDYFTLDIILIKGMVRWAEIGLHFYFA